MLMRERPRMQGFPFAPRVFHPHFGPSCGMTMENMAEMSDQQMNDSSNNNPLTPTGSHGSEFVHSPHELSPSRTVIATGVGNMIDSNEFRNHMGEVTYQTLNGRVSPGSYSPSGDNGSYATLMPLQPLPPISTVSDKFNTVNHIPTSHNVATIGGGGFAIMHGNTLGMDMSTYRYVDNKIATLGMSMGPTTLTTTPVTIQTNGYQAQAIGPYYTHNGLPSPNSIVKNESVVKMEHPGVVSYDYTRPALIPTHQTRIHSPNLMMTTTTLNGLQQSPPGKTSPQSIGSLSPQCDRTLSLDGKSSNGQELEELNTKDLAQKISSELKRYSIPQAVFAQRVLCRSQGTLSDLLRNPKPWCKLKSGRETFRRMWKWLQEPEFQRMSALRLAAKDSVKDPLHQILRPNQQTALE